jgi:hypothetical protein
MSWGMRALTALEIAAVILVLLVAAKIFVG